MYREAYEEAQRIIRISDEIRISLEKISREPDTNTRQEGTESEDSKLTTSKLAKKLGLKTDELLQQLISTGHLEARDSRNYLTAKGKEAGGEFRMSPKFGPYFLWPESLAL